jgi:alkylation response protein AidB-like acyl-CoA dehydrogenase
MDFDFTPEQQRFRAEARAWLAENVPADLKGRAFAASRADRHEVDRLREWQRTLHKAGYVGIDWPAEYGGRGVSIMEQIMLYEEMSRAEAPQPVNRGGISMLGPTPHEARNRRPAGAASRQDPQRGGAVVPGLLRAQCGQRPRQSPDAGRARRRLVRAERAEGLDEHGSRRRLGDSFSSAPTRPRPSTRASPSSSWT